MKNEVKNFKTQKITALLSPEEISYLEDSVPDIHALERMMDVEREPLIAPIALKIMAVVTVVERNKMSERIKFGRKMEMAKGIVPNFVFGYDRVDKYTLVPNPVESEWVKKIFDLYTKEHWSLYKIAQYLFENRVSTKQKKKGGQPNYKWSSEAVKRILANKIYLGLVINGKESTKSLYSSERIQNPETEWFVVERPEFRLISDEQYEEAQKIIKKRKHNSKT